jgi:phage-related protein
MAGTELERIKVVIEAQTSQFNAEMTKFNKQIAGIEKTTGLASAKITKSFMAIGAAVASLVSIGLVVKFGKDIMTTAGRIDDMAAKTGLSAERFQELEYAIVQTGGNLDTVARSIQTLSEAILTGNPALAEMGINTRNTGEAFEQVIHKLADMGDTVERNVLGQKLLGRAFIELKPSLAEGSAGIKTLTQAARNSGLIMSTGLVKSLGSVEDSLKALSTMVRSVFYPIIQGLIPLFQTLVNWLSIAAGFIRGVMEAIFGAPANSTEQADASDNNTQRIIANAVKIKRALAGFDELNVIPSTSTGASTTAPDFGNLGQLNTNLAGDIAKAKEQMLLFNKAVEDGKKFWEDYGNAIKIATTAVIVFWTAFALSNWLLSVGAFGFLAVAMADIISKVTVMSSLFGIFGTMGIASPIQAFTASLVALLGPVGAVSAIVLTVTGIIAAFTLAIMDLWKTNYDFRKNLIDTWDSIKDTFARVYNSFIKPIIDNMIFWFSMIWELALKPLWENFKIFVAALVRLVTSIWIAIKPVVDFLVVVFGPIIAGVFNLIVAAIGIVIITVSTLVGVFFKIFGAIINMVSDFVKAFGDLIGKIIGFVAIPVNAVIDVINYLIKALNKVSFKAPDWLKFIGLGDIAGKSFGVNLSLIPKLAQGGSLNAGNLFVAGEAGAEMIGNYNGKTTVMPLENTSFVKAMGDAVYGAVASALSEAGQGSSTLVVDGMVLARSVEKNLNKLATIQGGLNLGV